MRALPGDVQLGEPPGYYILAALAVWPFRDASLEAQVIIAWLVSVFLGGLTIWLAYLGARDLFPEDRMLPLVVMGMVGLRPSFSVLMSAVGNTMAAAAVRCGGCELQSQSPAVDVGRLARQRPRCLGDGSLRIHDVSGVDWLELPRPAAGDHLALRCSFSDCHCWADAVFLPSLCWSIYLADTRHYLTGSGSSGIGIGYDSTA